MTQDDEPTTSPDLAKYPCPGCPDNEGRPSGYVLDLQEWGTMHHARSVTCPMCRGAKVIGREAMAAYKAAREQPQ
jgi:hypothetical protein